MSLLEIENTILELKEKLEEKRRLERRLQHATDACNQSSKRIIELKEKLVKEEKEVKRLESVSLTSMWYSLIGTKREKIMKEQEEVDQALYEYKRLDQTLNPLREEIKSLRVSIDALSRVEVEYEQTLLRKEQHLMVEDNPIKEELTQLTEHMSYNNQQIKELNEAIEAGNVLLSGMQEAISSLESAKGWG
jgi:chromosome segregation ATPase